MIIVLRPDSTEAQIEHVLERIRELGFRPHLSQGEKRTIIGVIGEEDKLRALPDAGHSVSVVMPLRRKEKGTA